MTDVAQAAAALAVSMGIGRFVYTPILPLMLREAGLSKTFGATLATANYAGYLLGALVGIVAPVVIGSTWVMRVALLASVATLALMPTSHNYAAWLALRFVAGGASALVFMFAVGAMLSHPNTQHLVGWGFGGVGAGIALSGALVLITGSISTWSSAWWSSAVAALVLSGIAWGLTPPTPQRRMVSAPKADGIPPIGRWFSALLVAYSLEGIGYIIAGTFLVAAIAQTSPGWAGTGAWILVGVCAVPASALWAALGHRWSRPSLLLMALVLQAIGIGLPTVVAGIAPALLGAALFGSTFLGIGSLALALGAHLQFPRAIALLTTGYSVGQILGPQIVRPLLNNGYHDALFVGAVIVLTAAVAAAILRVKFPSRVGTMIEPSRLARLQISPARRGTR